MADTAVVPRRKIYVKFWEHPVLRTEDEIAELKAHGLFVRDAAPDDPLPSHVRELAAVAGQPARTVVTPPVAPDAGKPKE